MKVPAAAALGGRVLRDVSRRSEGGNVQLVVLTALTALLLNAVGVYNNKSAAD